MLCDLADFVTVNRPTVRAGRPTHARARFFSPTFDIHLVGGSDDHVGVCACSTSSTAANAAKDSGPGSPEDCTAAPHHALTGTSSDAVAENTDGAADSASGTSSSARLPASGSPKGRGADASTAQNGRSGSRAAQGGSPSASNGEVYVAIEKMLGKDHPRLGEYGLFASSLILNDCLENKKNLVIEIIGSEETKESFIAIIDAMRGRGYEIAVTPIIADVAESYQRHLKAVDEDPDYISAHFTEKTTLGCLLSILAR